VPERGVLNSFCSVPDIFAASDIPPILALLSVAGITSAAQSIPKAQLSCALKKVLLQFFRAFC
jgi:F0F1-type ATP synthase alpha subunit